MTDGSRGGEWLTAHPVAGIFGISALIGALQIDRGPVGVLVGFLISALGFGGVHAAERSAFRRGGEDAERRVRRNASLVLFGVLALGTLALFVIPAIA
jgi:hypothetical protein